MTHKLTKTISALGTALLVTMNFSSPAHAAASLQSSWSPSISLTGTTLSVTLPTWDSSTIASGSDENFIWACASQPPVLEALSPTVVPAFDSTNCDYLSMSNAGLAHPVNGQSGTVSVDLTTLHVYDFVLNTFESYTSRAGSISYLVVLSAAEDSNQNTYEVWTSIAHSGVSSSSSSEDEVPPPVYFGGPLVQGSTLPHFTQGEEGTVTLTGKRLNKISSATINGVAVTVTADRRSATITVPASLAAGTYDLVLQTTNGRLTVMRFIKVS